MGASAFTRATACSAIRESSCRTRRGRGFIRMLRPSSASWSSLTLVLPVRSRTNAPMGRKASSRRLSTSVRVRENGPLAVSCRVALRRRRSRAARDAVPLRRIENKPFCDGSHTAAGFAAHGRARDAGFAAAHSAKRRRDRHAPARWTAAHQGMLWKSSRAPAAR